MACSGNLHQELVGRSAPMGRLRGQIAAVAAKDCTVLLRGETGAGKEVVARRIHAASRRADGPFIPVDCTTLQSSLAESQLFGHQKGSFTGAQENTLGLLRAADGGTLFLDELGELPLDVQAKLLRCIESRSVIPLGQTQPVPVNVRILAATHRDLHAMAAEGKFRPDLLYRLDVVRIALPPLRDRKGDLPLLAEHFLDELAETYEEPRRTLCPEALRALAEFDWPGNVRQLRNAVEHAVVFAQSEVVQVEDLPDWLRPFAPIGVPPASAEIDGAPGLDTDDPADDPADDLADGSADPAESGVYISAGAAASDGPVETLAAAEARHIDRILRHTQGNRTLAAELLGIHRSRLRRKIEEYNLQTA